MSSKTVLYERMQGLSARMAEAARAGDWATLARIEESVAALHETLPERDLTQPDLTLQQKILMIQRIIDDDAEVRRHTEPWMERLLQLIGTPGRRGSIKHSCKT